MVLSVVETEKEPIGCTSTTRGRLAFDKSVEQLQPITTRQVSSRSINESIPIPSTSITAPSCKLKSPYLPPQCFTYTHPEGQVYFYRASKLRIVTEANIYCPDVMDQVVYWAQRLEERCCSEGISLPNDVELFLQLNESEADHCAYYFIEHGTRTQFWIDNVDTEALGLPPTVSAACIAHALEELYWKHVECFPMHLTNLNPNPVNSLVCLLSDARDNLITLNDHLPFPADECAKILKVLNILQDNISDANAMRLVARLWGVIANHNYITQSAWKDNGSSLFGRPMNHSPTSEPLENHGSGELQRLIDTIDKVLLSSGNPSSHCQLMVEIIINTGIIPTRSRLCNVAQNLYPERMTAGTNVFKGEYDGNAVAIKKPRHHSLAKGPGAVPADLYREYYILAMLDHPHILPVVGIFMDPHDSLPAVVTLYMDNGTISVYLDRNPDADRLRLLAEAASGFDYIHNLPIPVVHRDVRSENIMINANGHAFIIDFGSSLLLQPSAAFTTSLHDKSPGNPRWMAPETLQHGRYPITPKADVWSFAGLGIEIFSGKRPFDDIIRDGAVVIEVVVKNRRPSRPRDIASARQLYESVWALMEQSWEINPSDRPSMRDIYLLFSSLSRPASSA